MSNSFRKVKNYNPELSYASLYEQWPHSILDKKYILSTTVIAGHTDKGPDHMDGTGW